MSKQFLFYSNYCQHSKRVMDMLNKSNTSHNIILCNIDNNDVNIPDFITAVPTLYLADEKKILMNENLFMWINQNIGNSNNQEQNSFLKNADITGDNNISAFQQNELGSCFSDTYSFISNNNEKTALNHTFSFLESENNIPNFTKNNVSIEDNNTSNNNSEKNKVLDKAYEQLISQRNNEVSSNISSLRV